MGSAKAQRIAFFAGAPAIFVGVGFLRLAGSDVTAPVQAEPVVVDCGAPPRELPDRTWVRVHNCRVVEEPVLEGLPDPD